MPERPPDHVFRAGTVPFGWVAATSLPAGRQVSCVISKDFELTNKVVLNAGRTFAYSYGT